MKNIKQLFLFTAFIAGIVFTGMISWNNKPAKEFRVTTITNNGTKNSLPANQLPSGYTKPSVTTFTDYKYTRQLTLTVAKTAVESATASTTMTNIFADTVVGLNKQVSTILAADFSSSATVTAYADLMELTTNLKDVSGNSVALKNTAVAYVCKLTLYVKTN